MPFHPPCTSHILAYHSPEVAGQACAVKQFIWDDESITQYKLTRNCLDGFDGSSTFSPWLANGNLSVREVAHTIFDFEKSNVANESTYWLFFELLWREFSTGAPRLMERRYSCFRG